MPSIKGFKIIVELKPSDSNHFQNQVWKCERTEEALSYDPGILRGSQCYVKRIQTKADTHREVVGQEVLRLAHPAQPKTTWTQDTEDNYYVVSESLPEQAIQLTSFDPKEFQNGVIRGEIISLAKLMVLMQWMGENDAREDNFFLVPHNGGWSIVKIDGDQILAFLQQVQEKYSNIHPEYFTIQRINFESLPYIVLYRPYNWFDMIRDYGSGSNKLLAIDMKTSKYFNNEIQETFLTLANIENTDIQNLCINITEGENAKEYYEPLFARKAQMLKISAEMSFSFAPNSAETKFKTIDTQTLRKQMAKEYYDNKLITFDFTQLTHGNMTPVYVDNRMIISKPQLWKLVVELIQRKVKASNIDYDRICGVFLGAVIESMPLSLKLGKPMILMRNEQKKHGKTKMIEGAYTQGENILVIEDFIETGQSAVDMIVRLRNEGLNVTDVMVIFEGEWGGRQKLAEIGCRLHSVFTLPEFLDLLQNAVDLKPEENEAIKLRLEAKNPIAPEQKPAKENYPATTPFWANPNSNAGESNLNENPKTESTSINTIEITR